MNRGMLTLLWFGLAMTSEVSFAADGNALRLGISDELLLDGNLFRLPDGDRPFIEGNKRPRSDRINIATFSGSFDRVYSRQRLVADISVSHHEYQEFKHLDYTAKNVRAGWYWAVGSMWSGVLVADQSQLPRSFSDRANTVRSVNTYRHYAFDARYLLHPEWMLGAGLARIDSRFDDRVSASSEYVEDGLEALATFRSMTGSTFALVARAADGRYPARTASETTVTAYDQREIQVRIDWAASAHSRITGYAGHTWREYPELAEKNFSGPTGRLTYDWAPSSKVALGVTVRREMGAREDVVDNFVVTRATSFDPVWSVTGKLRVRGRLEWLARDYEGTPFIVSGPDRDEKGRSHSVSIEWSPMDDLLLRVGLRREHRSSSDAVRSYADDIISVAIKYAL